MCKHSKDLKAYQIRCAQAEKTIEDCVAAFELLPIWALERGQNWIPSEVAILLLKRAKDSVNGYSAAHWRTDRGTSDLK